MLIHRLSRTAVCVLSLAAAACGVTTDPDIAPDLDADAALEDYAAMEAILASPDLEGFQALGSRTPFGSAIAGADVVAGLSAPSALDGGRSFARNLAGALVRHRSLSGAEPAAAPVISGITRGKTFVYDPEVDDYRLAPDREGAPENGVRFIMYEVDEAGVPILETEIGYADLLDEGEGSAEDIVLRLLVVQRDETVLDYRTTLDVTDDGGALTVQGFAVGDGARLDFDIAASGREVPGGGELLDLDFDLSVESRDFRILGAVTGIDEADDDVGRIDISVTHGSESVRLDIAGTEGELDGTVYVNGSVFATVTGPEADPVFQDATGQPLTLRQLLVLRHAFEAFGNVLGFLEDLLDPVDEIVFLGIIL